jgi:hypothetical protein
MELVDPDLSKKGCSQYILGIFFCVNQSCLSQRKWPDQPETLWGLRQDARNYQYKISLKFKISQIPTYNPNRKHADIAFI